MEKKFEKNLKKNSKKFEKNSNCGEKWDCLGGTGFQEKDQEPVECSPKRGGMSVLPAWSGEIRIPSARTVKQMDVRLEAILVQWAPQT